MAEDGKVIFTVGLDDSNVASEGEAAGRKAGDGVERGAAPGANGFEQMMIGAARRIGEAFLDMAAKAVQGVEQIARAGIEFNAKMEQYQVGFETLLGSEEEAAKVMAQIRDDAARTPFDVDSLTQATRMMVSTGMSADDARKDVLNLANAIAATGGGSAELSRMAANMQQIKNTGKATAMDIRQFANAGINIYGLLADSMGITAAQAAEMDVTYEQLAYALQHAADAGGMYEGAMEAQSQTFNGRMSTLKDNVTQLEGALTEDLFNQLSGNYLPMLMDWVATLLEATQTGGIEGAIGAAKEIVTNLAKQLIAEAPSIIKSGVELVVNLANTFVQKIPDIISAGVKLLSGLITSLSDSGAVEKLLHAAGEIVRAIWTGLIQNGPQILEAAAKLVGMLLRGILQYVGEVATTAMELATTLIETIKNTDWLSVGKNIIDGITEGFVQFWNNLSDTVASAMQNLWESVKGFFGIASPSKKFKWIGEMNVEGMIEGMEDQQSELTRTVRDVYGGVPDTAIDAMRYMGDMERNVSFNMTATGSMADTQITVPLFLDGREIARATAWSMGQQLAWEEI